MADVDSSLQVASSAEALLHARAQVVVDFTHPDAVFDNIRFALDAGIAVVVGTSGFDETRFATLRGWLDETPGHVLVAPNFGIGAVLASSLVPRHRRARAVAMTMMGLTVANVVGVPLTTLLGQWLGGLWRGDAGRSWISGGEVMPDVLQALGASLLLMSVALLVAFVTAARTRPALRPEARRLHQGMRTLIGKVLTEGGVSDAALETERLASLLDGLAVNGVLQPDLTTPDVMRAVLRRHLESLTTG